jgi:hypothetical protein
MKQFSLNGILLVSLLACSGCVSTSISDSLAAIGHEDTVANSRDVNKKLLTSIQALRRSQNIAEQSYTFAYDLNNKELNVEDKTKIVSLVINNHQNIVINIAPAKGANNFEKLALSMARAEVLRLYIGHFNNKVTIKFAPKLSTNTVNLVTGV